MDHQTMRKIERRWVYEHSPAYLANLTIEKMRLQRERDEPSLSEITREFLPSYNNRK